MSKKTIFFALLVVFSLVISACGGAAVPAADSEPAQGAASSEQPAAQTSSEQPAAESSGQPELAKELSVYNWGDYIDESLLTQYEEKYGVKIIYDTFASNEDLLAKLQAGATGYDVIFPSDYMVAQMIELGMLAEVDKNNIPNLKNIDPFFLNAPYDPNNVHCVPYQWGTTGLAYKVDSGLEPPTSWADLFDPANAQKWQAAGGINVLNDQRELMAAALKYLGYSLNEKDEAKLEEAKNAILAIKPYIKTFNSEDYDDSLLIPGEVALSHSWSGDAAKAYWETYDEASDTSQWGYVIPKEGAMVWQDNICVTATSSKKYTAEHFMNFLLEPEVIAAVSNYTYYANPNLAANQYMDEAILNDPSIYPPKEVMDKLEWAQQLGETIFVYDRLWTEIKSQ